MQNHVKMQQIDRSCSIYINWSKCEVEGYEHSQTQLKIKENIISPLTP